MYERYGKQIYNSQIISAISNNEGLIKEIIRLAEQDENDYIILLIALLFENTELKSRCTCLNRITDPALEIIYKSIRSKHKLKLSGKIVSVEDLSKITPHFRCFPNCEILDIERNGIGREGLNVLCPSLRFMQNLKTIVLGENNISDNDIDYFSHSLFVLCHLKRLELPCIFILF